MKMYACFARLGLDVGEDLLLDVEQLLTRFGLRAVDLRHRCTSGCVGWAGERHSVALRGKGHPPAPAHLLQVFPDTLGSGCMAPDEVVFHGRNRGHGGGRKRARALRARRLRRPGGACRRASPAHRRACRTTGAGFWWCTATARRWGRWRSRRRRWRARFRRSRSTCSGAMTQGQLGIPAGPGDRRRSGGARAARAEWRP